MLVVVLLPVVMGTKDSDWPDAEAKACLVVEALSTELVLVDGAGHCPQTEMPDKTTPAILDFLARVGTRKSPANAEEG